MGKVKFTQALAEHYQELYATLEVRPNKFQSVDKITDGLLRQQQRYTEVGDRLSVPWYLVGAIHNMESGLRFDRHLHNGDPLTKRTRQIPKGRPKSGTPPFTWEESAEDALKLRGLHLIKTWTLPRVLYEAEGYNGWGYRQQHPEVLSPYLWSFSTHYSMGKYVADGRWSATAVSRQCGLATLLRRLEERGEIRLLEGRQRHPFFRFSKRKSQPVEDLQRFLNTVDGIVLRVDGQPGLKTSDAVQSSFGHRLQGDPRS